MTVEYCCRITLFTLPKAVQQQFQGEVGNYNFLVLRLLMDVVYQELLRSVIFHRVLSLSVFLPQFHSNFSRFTWFSRQQNVSILVFTGAKNDRGGGDGIIHKTEKGVFYDMP